MNCINLLSLKMAAPGFLVIGAGSRGCSYARAVTLATSGTIVAVAEPDDFKWRNFGKKYIWRDKLPHPGQELSRKSDTTFGQGTIPELSTSHIGKGVALVALVATFVYIYARIPQIAEMTLKFLRNTYS